jgi:tRNA pseudouridine38-40 synthase
MADYPKTASNSWRNIRLTLAYDGTDFYGWQRQPNVPTVQGLLEERLGRILGEAVSINGSGRTDAGVHAVGQVANFKTTCPIPCPNLVVALNHSLPPAIRVHQASDVPPEFHARHDARSKTYRYRILQAHVCSPFLWRFVWHCPHPLLDHERMAEAAKLFEGEHDFRSFAAGDGQAREDLAGSSSPEHDRGVRGRGGTTVRIIFRSRLFWRTRARMLVYEVTGSGFLHRMVRNMVGTMIEVGRQKLAPTDIPRLLAARERRLAGPTAPPQGLCLMKVEYGGVVPGSDMSG